MAGMSLPILTVRGLHVIMGTGRERVHVLRGVDLDLFEGGSLALIGESGSGKTVLAFALLRLLDGVGEVHGEVSFRGEDIYGMSRDRLLTFRGSTLCLIPQSPGTAFDPLRRVGVQMGDFYRKVEGLDPIEARRRSLGEMERLRLRPSEEVYMSYPHRMSGGMLERALIGCATGISPTIIVADEPTKGLDRETKDIAMQALLEKATVSSLMVITHDIDAAALCERIAILYKGEIVEVGKAADVLRGPMHPYTRGLLGSMPRRGLSPIPRMVRDPVRTGCGFYDRCKEAKDVCREHPALKKVGERTVRCWIAVP